MSAAAKPLPVELVDPPSRTSDGFGDEFELLLVCCVNLTPAGRRSRIPQLFASHLDWWKFLEIAQHHNLLPQVYTALSETEELPSDFRLELRRRYGMHVRKALWFAAELGRVIAQLQERGICALPYKGPALAQLLYGDVTRREFGDLDILVSPASVAKAKTALADLGYRCQQEGPPSHATHAITTGYECSFDGPGGPHSLELQWRIVPRFYAVDFDVPSLFRGATTVEVGGMKVATPGKEDLFLVLCVHAAKHGWSRLGWLCDIAKLAELELDWVRVQSGAKRLGIARIVSVNLILIQRLLGAKVEKKLICDPQAEALAARIEAVIRQSSHYDTETTSYFGMMIRVRERWQDRLRFLWRLALTPSGGDLQTIRLPGFLFPLYRVVRLLRLSRRFARWLSHGGFPPPTLDSPPCGSRSHP